MGAPARGAPRVVAGADDHGPVGDPLGAARAAARSTRPDRQLDMLRTVTRRAEHVDHHAEIYAGDRASRPRRAAGRPQPGAVEIPIDLQYATGDVDVVDVARRSAGAAPDAATVAPCRATGWPTSTAAVDLWPAAASSRVVRPSSWCELAERLGAPVLTSVEGRGAIPEDHPLGVGAERRHGGARPGDRRRRRRARGRHAVPVRQQPADGAVDPRPADPPRCRSGRDRPLPPGRLGLVGDADARPATPRWPSSTGASSPLDPSVSSTPPAAHRRRRRRRRRRDGRRLPEVMATIRSAARPRRHRGQGLDRVGCRVGQPPLLGSTSRARRCDRSRRRSARDSRSPSAPALATGRRRW